MRKWRVCEPGLNGDPHVYIITDTEIIAHYFLTWRSLMERVGKKDLVNWERCIEDFVTVHWAEEVKE